MGSRKMSSSSAICLQVIFRLKLEIKLIDNQGNSGIQFRSQPQEHGILGYQADVGPGWWGKLYEEEGELSFGTSQARAM